MACHNYRMQSSDLTLRLATDPDRKAWDAVVSHPLQSWAWGDFRTRMEIDTVRLAGGNSGTVESAWQMTFHPIPHTPYTVGYAPKTEAPTDAVLDELVRIGKQRRAVYIQLEPDVRRNAAGALPARPALVPSHHALFTKYTFLYDLTPTEDQLLASMHSKTRYNLRVATKHGVTVTLDDSPEAFERYLALSKETTTRQGFFAHNERYQRTMWEVMHNAGIAHLFTAVYEGETLAAWVIFDWKDRIYYPYGSSSRNHREVMAPTLLLWEIARWGKKNGKTAFDLWGAMGPDPDVNDPWYGFHRFKEGFKPELVEFAGSYDLVIHPLGYRMFTVADTLRWKALNLSRKR
jgi:lipid II:glycine glycyltransferase (peptidoglycan interpeptide bridge formation enzyme)